MSHQQSTKTENQIQNPSLAMGRRISSSLSESSSNHQQHNQHHTGGGWKAVFGCTYGSLALFRIGLGLLLTLELLLRFRVLKPFYSEEGTLPIRLMLPKIDTMYKLACFHLSFKHLWQQQVLLAAQTLLSILLTVGYRTNIVAPLCWYWYWSLTLRNTWMNYILDRYFHYLLFLSMFLPLDACWAFSSSSSSSVSTKQLKNNKSTKSGPTNSTTTRTVVSPGTVFLKALVIWIYLDAGGGKYMDPLGGWTYAADPLPALDTYARHTVPAQYLYAILGPEGLRMMTPTVVWVELLAAPVALVGLYFEWRSVLYTAVSLIVSLHVGIAITLRNSALLSFIACVPWLAFIIPGGCRDDGAGKRNTERVVQVGSKRRNGVAMFFLSAMVIGNLWLETISQACDQSVKHIWSTTFHNRWNVFVGAEEYVTWEIAPGQLVDGSIVDVWGRREEVNWNLPGGGAPCTAANGRPGRWRSFPYLAGLEGDDADALWSYLCREWDEENDVTRNPGRKLTKFNFFMLQADVLPNMGFGPTRKRLVQSFDCVAPTVQTSSSSSFFDEGSAAETDEL